MKLSTPIWIAFLAVASLCNGSIDFGLPGGGEGAKYAKDRRTLPPYDRPPEPKYITPAGKPSLLQKTLAITCKVANKIEHVLEEEGKSLDAAKPEVALPGQLYSRFDGAYHEVGYYERGLEQMTKAKEKAQKERNVTEANVMENPTDENIRALNQAKAQVKETFVLVSLYQKVVQSFRKWNALKNESEAEVAVAARREAEKAIFSLDMKLNGCNLKPSNKKPFSIGVSVVPEEEPDSPPPNDQEQTIPKEIWTSDEEMGDSPNASGSKPKLSAVLKRLIRYSVYGVGPFGAGYLVGKYGKYLNPKRIWPLHSGGNSDDYGEMKKNWTGSEPQVLTDVSANDEAPIGAIIGMLFLGLMVILGVAGWYCCFRSHMSSKDVEAQKEESKTKSKTLSVSSSSK